MALRGVQFRRQVGGVLMYKGREVGKAWLDFLVEECVVLELKSVEQIASVHTAQLISYLSMTGHPLGLIITSTSPPSATASGG